MLQQLTLNARRQVAALFGDRAVARPLDDATTNHPVLSRQAEIGSLRGVTPAAADVSECACPESCERDHANE